MSVHILNSDSFDSFISKGNVIVDFYADWCGPCKMMEPQFKKAAESLTEIKFGKLNVDGSEDIASRFDVMSIPTTIFFKDGEIVERHTGAMTAAMIERKTKDVF
jgi:thioredoxin